jgi:hypothetical protein
MKPRGKPRRASLVRKDGRRLERATLYLPPDVAREFRVYCAARGLPMSDVAAEAIAAYLASHARPTG